MHGWSVTPLNLCEPCDWVTMGRTAPACPAPSPSSTLFNLHPETSGVFPLPPRLLTWKAINGFGLPDNRLRVRHPPFDRPRGRRPAPRHWETDPPASWPDSGEPPPPGRAPRPAAAPRAVPALH